MVNRQIVFASHNQGKIKEVRALLSKLNVEVLSADDLDLADVEENGSTFEENATLKALAASKASGLPAIADDSGLCIHALHDEPGIYSARYAKKMGGYEEAFADVLRRLKNQKDKTAHFMCVLVLAFPNGTTKVYNGRVDGHIVPPKDGQNGFGFDPIFMPDGYTQTFAELSDAKKNKISHRGKAMSAFIKDFKESF